MRVLVSIQSRVPGRAFSSRIRFERRGVIVRGVVFVTQPLNAAAALNVIV
jgi:hypothetical protein